MNRPKSLLLLLLAVLLTRLSYADTGPTQAPLRVTTMYTAGNGGSVYVEFEAGAMPGCYSDAGGQLKKSNPDFEVVYSQVLTMMATGGVRGKVLYTVTSGSGWAKCRIDGFWLLPDG